MNKKKSDFDKSFNFGECDEVKTIRFKKLVPEAELPTYAHDGDIGLDVKCTSVEYDPHNDVYICGTGLACETTGHMGVLGMMKSGVYKKGDCYLTNAVGLIDSDQYRGEIKFIYRSRTAIGIREINLAILNWLDHSWLWRLTHSLKKIHKDIFNYYDSNLLSLSPYKVGDVCGQLVPLSFDKVEVLEVDELSETERGDGGFGSTDEKEKKPTKKSNKKVSKVVKES